MDTPVRNPTLILALCAVLAGCSPAWFRDSADSQVGKLVRDRELKTLGYTPDVDVSEEIPKAPPKKAFARIPVSPVPPPTTSPVEFQHVELPRVPAGPELRWNDAAPVEGMPSGAEALQQRTAVGGPGFIGPPTPEDFYRRYELLGLLEYAVRHSRGYHDQMENLYLAALDVTLQRHLLHPIPFVREDLNYNAKFNPAQTTTNGVTSTDYKLAAAMSAATSMGIQQKLPYGGQIAASTVVTFIDALTEQSQGAETAAVTLSGSLPLLRGAGMVNLEGLISSERQLVYQVRAFEQFRRNFVVTVASSYFRLLASQQNVFNRRLNLSNLAALTERTQTLYDNGRIIFLQVQQALQSQLFAQSALIDAEEQYQAALDSFKLLIGMPVDERLEIVPVQLEVPIPKYREREAIELAMRYRLDLRTAADQVDDAQRAIANAKNGLLPDVNLTGQITGGNFAGTPASSLDDRTLQYAAGVRIDLPVDRVAERNTLRRALISFQKAQRNLSQQKGQVVSDVRDSMRTIRAATATEIIQRKGIELAQRRLEYSNELLKNSQATARDVVEAQTSLLNAQDQHEQAKAQLYIRVLEFLRDTGTLRVDPTAGALAMAMDRAAPPTTQPAD